MKLGIGRELLKRRSELARIDEMMKRGIQRDAATGLEYFTGYSYNTLYDWDQYFEAIVQIYMGWKSDYIKNGVLIFLENQEADGFIPRHIPKGDNYRPPEHVKPFLAQIALLVADNYGEKDWIIGEGRLDKLDRYLRYWLFDLDKDGNGLSEWMSAPHTGMDNQHERAGFWGDGFCEGTDLNCYLVSECLAMAKLCRLAGRDGPAAEFERFAAARKDAVNALLWDETDGFYYDRNIYAGTREKSPGLPWPAQMNQSNDERIRHKFISSFAPLFSGVASRERAVRLVDEHLLNPDEFWSGYPVRAMAANEKWYSNVPLPVDLGCNWRGSTWIPTNYMLIRGLRRYGFSGLAEVLARKTARLVKTAGDREWYDADSGEGRGLDPFWGWSLLGYFVEYETEDEGEEQ